MLWCACATTQKAWQAPARHGRYNIIQDMDKFMNAEKRFRTKTGYCHIFSDKIVLTRDGFVGNVAKVTVGNTITRTLTIYVFIAVVLIYYGLKRYNSGDTIIAVLFGLFALFLIYGVLTSLNNSATPIINRDSIKSIVFKKGIKGLTRARFEVFFTNEKGKPKKRLIMLPGSLTGGQTETDIAYKIMIEEKLIEE